MLEPLSFILSALVLGWAAWEDYKHGELEVSPLWFFILGGAFVAALVSGIESLLLVFVVFGCLFLSELDSDLLGGVDLKLFAGLLIWHGWIALLPIVFGCCLAVGYQLALGVKRIRFVPFLALGFGAWLACYALLVARPVF